jgi:KDO2-lipid IV(A) lauroyltransferase
MKLLIFSSIMRVLSWVSPRAAEYIAPPIAAVIWFLSPRKRRVTRLNLRAVYPDMNPAQRKKIGRASMTQYVRGIFEAGMLWYWPLEKLYGLFDDVQGMEHIEQVIKAGTGMIVAAPHCGSWEMLNLYLHSKGEAAILYKPSRFPDFDAILIEKRRRGGADMVPATASGLRKMFKLLTDGHFVALLPDQEPTGGGCRAWPSARVHRLFLLSAKDVKAAVIVCTSLKRMNPFTAKICARR